MFLLFCSVQNRVGLLTFFFQPKGTGAKYLVFVYFFAYKDLMNPLMEITEKSTKDCESLYCIIQTQVMEVFCFVKSLPVYL